MRILPWMLPVFSFTMPAALVVYFVISNLYRIGQQGYITRSLYSGEDSLGAQARRSREEAQAKENAGGGRKQAGGRTTPKKVSRHQSVPTLVRRPNRRVLGEWRRPNRQGAHSSAIRWTNHRAWRTPAQEAQALSLLAAARQRKERVIPHGMGGNHR